MEKNKNMFMQNHSFFFSCLLYYFETFLLPTDREVSHIRHAAQESAQAYHDAALAHLS